MKKIFLTSLIFLSIFLTMGTASVYAGANNPGDGGASNSVGVKVTLDNPFKNCGGNDCTLFTLLEKVISDILLPIGGVLAVLAFIFSGFLYVTAQGNESKLKTAHQALLYTSIGTAVLLGSWVIAKLIEATIKQLI